MHFLIFNLFVHVNGNFYVEKLPYVGLQQKPRIIWVMMPGSTGRKQ